MSCLIRLLLVTADTQRMPFVSAWPRAGERVGGSHPEVPRLAAPGEFAYSSGVPSQLSLEALPWAGKEIHLPASPSANLVKIVCWAGLSLGSKTSRGAGVWRGKDEGEG